VSVTARDLLHNADTFRRAVLDAMDEEAGQ
jgi:hypothetical protein